MILRNGSRGQAVRELQQTLYDAGFNLQVDGIYGPETSAVVQMYQESAGLMVDGIAGPETLGSLGLYDPSSTQPGGGYATDKDSQTTRDYVNNIAKSSMDGSPMSNLLVGGALLVGGLVIAKRMNKPSKKAATTTKRTPASMPPKKKN